MTPADFLRAVWPDEGIYVIATPFVPAGRTEAVYAHKTYTTLEDAAAFAEAKKGLTDVFFAVHTMREAQVWNPTKTNWRTGEPGAYEVRTQSNALAARCFFLDLDVGVSAPDRAPKYPTQRAALEGLLSFCRTTDLPTPMVTSSGGGLHVYWLMDEAMPSEVWRGHAADLRQLTRHHGLLADPARTTDTASVLRVAGTYNMKDPENPRPVRTLLPGLSLPAETMIAQLRRALVRVGSTPAAGAMPAHLSAALSNLGTNLQQDNYDGPPVSVKALVTVCPQFQRLARLAGNVSEPEWYHSLNLMRFVENGRVLAHKISDKHPSYDPGQTDKKMAQLDAKGIGPSTCTKLEEVCGGDACARCALRGLVKSPIVAARMRDSAPAPVVQTQVGGVVVSDEIPAPPSPFTRLKSGGIAMEMTNGEGDPVIVTIYENDLYPLRRTVLSDGHSKTEQQVWRAVLPRSGPSDFTIDADALYDRRKFLTAVSNNGIYPRHNNIQHLQDYMTAYIAELQRLADATPQNTHLGWSETQDTFTLPDRVLHTDGRVLPAILSLGAERAAAQVTKAGTLQEQVDLMAFYNHPAYLPNQLYILCGLAAPIFFATGHHGVVVHATGEPGASKSTSLYTAASFYGNPTMYPLNGTNTGATALARASRVSVLSSLPVCVDEITHMSAKEAADLVMGITQPADRIRLERTGVEKAQHQSFKATIMLSSANKSLHSVLSLDNTAGTAGSMRVVEVPFKASVIHKKHEADDYLHRLKQNYGHIGDAFICHVVKHRDAVAAQVRATMREIDDAAGIQSSERFWSGAIAAALVAGDIARALGLLPFDTTLLRNWCLNNLVPLMRGVVVAEYASPLGILSDYLEEINADILVMGKPLGGNMSHVTRPPRGRLLAHYDTTEKVLWVLKRPFKDYCARIGASATDVLAELNQPKTDVNGSPTRVVSNTHAKKVLGAGTEFAKSQSWTFVVNMAHPEVSGVHEVVVTPGAATTPTRGNLKAVT